MKRDVEFLYELGALRLMPRQWSRFHMPAVANNSEHMFRVTWIALVIAAREGGELDTAKIMKMAMLHDIAESRTGDVDYLARQYVTRDENSALEDMLTDTSMRAELAQMWQEYEARQSPEAKIVKDADTLDIDFELCEQASSGHTLPAQWKSQRDQVGKTRLFTDSAKKLQQEIWNTNPHAWHVDSPKNRLHGGDWKDTDHDS
ncbi:HD domain-containing protein [Aeromicrobium sp.]|nr:HD domain-containing protein [Candidatus Saccharibacteria bacterium]